MCASNALFALMKDRPDRQIALRFLTLLHCHQLQVQAPQLGWVAFGQIGAQQVAPFAPPRSTQLLPAQR